jgi:spore coat protein U-like protein
MTPARSLLLAVLAVVLLISPRPMAGGDQFPRGLLSAESKSQFCTIETRPLSFGTFDPLAGTTLDATGQILYTCGNGNGNGPSTQESSKAIRIEMAQGSSNSFGTRAMVGPGADNLTYNIYLDATHRTVWGDGTGSTQTYYDAHPPNRTPVIVPAFGRIDSRQDVEAGPYVDSVAVRILF